MLMRTFAQATNSLLVIAGVSASPSDELHATGLIMVIPPEAVFIVTGINMGPVIVDIEPLETRPLEARPGEGAGGGRSADEWEDVAEFTARRIAGAPITVHGEMELPPAGVPDLSPGDASFVRIRVSARGRDLDYDLAVSEPREHYLVQVWPTDDLEEPVTGAASSTTAQRWCAAGAAQQHRRHDEQ